MKKIDKADIAMRILMLVFVGLFAFCIVWFAVNFRVISAAQKLGEMAREFYPIIVIAIVDAGIGTAILLLYWKYFAFRF